MSKLWFRVVMFGEHRVSWREVQEKCRSQATKYAAKMLRLYPSDKGSRGGSNLGSDMYRFSC